jgi:hypothetical protein
MGRVAVVRSSPHDGCEDRQSVPIGLGASLLPSPIGGRCSISAVVIMIRLIHEGEV